MSDVEIYIIAKIAREKLLSEYYLRDHNLQKLVAHANLYDNLLDSYYKQDGADPKIATDTEKVAAKASSSTSKNAAFHIPTTNFPKIGGREVARSTDERSTRSSVARKGDVDYYESTLVSECSHLGISEESTEVTIVEMDLQDDG